MAYFPVHKLNIPARNARRAGVASAAVFALLALSGTLFMFGWETAATACFFAAHLAALVALVLAIPILAMATALLLAPAAAYLIAAFNDYPVLSRWWFWLFVVTDIGLAVVMIRRAKLAYRPREN